MTSYTQEEWNAEGARRFGPKARFWKFVCPACKTVQTPKELMDSGMDSEQVQKVMGYSCIGRFVRGKGCDWTLDGLFHIHTAEVVFPDGKKRPVFEFATEAVAKEPV